MFSWGESRIKLWNDQDKVHGVNFRKSSPSTQINTLSSTAVQWTRAVNVITFYLGPWTHPSFLNVERSFDQLVMYSWTNNHLSSNRPASRDNRLGERWTVRHSSLQLSQHSSLRPRLHRLFRPQLLRHQTQGEESQKYSCFFSLSLSVLCLLTVLICLHSSWTEFGFQGRNRELKPPSSARRLWTVLFHPWATQPSTQKTSWWTTNHMHAGRSRSLKSLSVFDFVYLHF